MKNDFLVFFGILILALAIFLAIANVFAVDQIKTAEFFVFSSESQITSTTSSQFSVYIGDNLAGVSNPVKSVYFTVVGVYTGNGSLKLGVDSDPATEKTFTLPSASTPTAFEILYKDDSNKINPTSAGNYAYTLNITPSGITVSGISAKMNLTHRYKPPSCGGGYYAYGEIISPIFDTGAANGVEYNWIMASGTAPLGTAIKAQLATSNSSSSGTFVFRGGDNCNTGDYYSLTVNQQKELKCFSDFNNKRYFQYKIKLCSSSDCSSGGSATPQVEKVIVNWSP